jgi:holo-[acyl-carrier protein] synthase
LAGLNQLIYGIGTDIIEVSRIQKVMERDIGFREKIFSEGEIAYCEKMKNKFQHYAARFSAKEAFMKALGTGWRDGIRLSGKALEMAKNAGMGEIHISLSHVKEIASAVVVVEKK